MNKQLFVKKAISTALLLSVGCLATSAAYAASKPNILVIMSDDVGITNLSAYSRGMAGYKTPNID